MRPARTALAAAAVVLLIGVLATLMWPRTTSPPNGGDANERIDPIDPQTSGPGTVAGLALARIFSWRPGPDTSSWEATQRAADLLTGPMAQAAAAPPSPLPRPVAEWEAWAREGDTITAAIASTGAYTTTGDAATVPVVIVQIVTHPGGQSTPYRRNTITAQLARTLYGWKLARYTITEVS
ncbi:hypothetical protein ACWDUL_20620 [Nocardia niigatensis]